MLSNNTHLNNQRGGTEHIRSIYAIEISFDFWYARPSCGGSKAYTEKSSNKSQEEICSGKVDESHQVPKSIQISTNSKPQNFSIHYKFQIKFKNFFLPFFFNVTDHFQKLITSNVFNGKIYESGNDSCEKSNKTSQCPFRTYVLQHLNFGSASPIMLKQIVFIDPEFKPNQTQFQNW